MSYSLDFRNKAVLLRKQGYSLREIIKRLSISQSTASLWLRDIKLTDKATNRLANRKILGQYKSIQTKKETRERATLLLEKDVRASLGTFKLDQTSAKLLSSIFFWTEGGRLASGYVTIINSDPAMVTTFLRLLRLSYDLDEKKFRALLHLHEYHSESKVKEFWVGITKIPSSQFSKSYQKAHTKVRKREGYKGCIRIRYYDVRVAKELKAFYNVFSRDCI